MKMKLASHDWIQNTYESSSAQPDPGSDNRRKIKYFSKQFW
jgi:hypothetical protein